MMNKKILSLLLSLSLLCSGALVAQDTWDRVENGLSTLGGGLCSLGAGMLSIGAAACTFTGYGAYGLGCCLKTMGEYPKTTLATSAVLSSSVMAYRYHRQNPHFFPELYDSSASGMATVYESMPSMSGVIAIPNGKYRDISLFTVGGCAGATLTYAYFKNKYNT